MEPVGLIGELFGQVGKYSCRLWSSQEGVQDICKAFPCVMSNLLDMSIFDTKAVRKVTILQFHVSALNQALCKFGIVLLSAAVSGLHCDVIQKLARVSNIKALFVVQSNMVMSEMPQLMPFSVRVKRNVIIALVLAT